MKEQVLPLEKIFKVLLHWSWLILLFVTIGAATAWIISDNLSKRYKAKATLTIQSSYFENPLVNDILSEVHDPNELNARRGALLRLALSDQFLDSLGEEFGFFSKPFAGTERTRERELLLQRISFFSMTPTTYQVTAVWNDPQVAFEVTKRVISRMIETLIDQRYGLLLNTRDSIKSHVESLGLTLRDISSPAAALDPESLRTQLEKINKDLEALLANYTEKHPEVIRLKEQALAIENLLANRSDSEANKGAGYLPPNAKEPIQEIYNELLKKLNYLNIILEIEKDSSKVSHVTVIEQPTLPTAAFFPNKKLFVAIGAATGMLLAFVLIVFIELRRGAFVSTENLELKLEVPFFGSLPPLDSTEKVLLIGGVPSGNAVRKTLPQSIARGA